MHQHCRPSERQRIGLLRPHRLHPDGDGLNDVWLPVVRGVSNYALRITNRWGEVVFETTDPEEPWLGQMGTDGQHYCPNGVLPLPLRCTSTKWAIHVWQKDICVAR